ncbi:MAG: S41 family peptidase [Empedobacter falsenii]
MNRLFFLLTTCFFSITLQAQIFQNDSTKTFVEKSLNIIEANALNLENIDKIKKIFYTESINKKTVNEIAPLFVEVFKNLNDYHGSLKYKGKSYGWSKPTTVSNKYLKGKIKTEKNVVSQLLNKNIGYLRIPGNSDFSFKKVDSIANDIVANINSKNSNKIKGWIIDLRVNTGGNMYPILLGLKEFIGNNLVFGGFINSKNEITGNWEIKNNELLIDNNPLERKSKFTFVPKLDVPIVVLTSNYTASAGEMTAISLIGRPNTYTVGESSANYTTAVQGFEIDDNSAINLSTDYVFDRNKRKYIQPINPDYEIINGDNFENLYEDAKVIKALELLNQ